MTPRKGTKTAMHTQPNVLLQQQQQPTRPPGGPPASPVAPTHPPGGVRVDIKLCIPEDQQPFLPKRQRAPLSVPLDVPMPRLGEVIYLSSSSAWQVDMVVHEWRSPMDLRIELWLERIGSARHARPPGFEVTQ